VETDIRRSLDWGQLAPLRLRARRVAEGVYAGAHRSARKGAGVEFGGHREYTPGDDLRWLDRRSMMLHDRLLIRQFETETDRALRLVIDATSSMAYRGSRGKAAKLAWAALVAAALARVATASGDPVGMTFIGGGKDVRPVPVSSGREAFERVVSALEAVEPGGDASSDPKLTERALGGIVRAARRGSIVVVLSDLCDLPDAAIDAMAAVAARGRVLVVGEVLDPDELEFPFDEAVRLRALEGGATVETDGQVRDKYLAALAAHRDRWRRALTARGAEVVSFRTDHDATGAVREIVDRAHRVRA
jgi:uncharacterized protein (DUF58 family)